MPSALSPALAVQFAGGDNEGERVEVRGGSEGVEVRDGSEGGSIRIGVLSGRPTRRKHKNNISELCLF